MISLMVAGVMSPIIHRLIIGCRYCTICFQKFAFYFKPLLLKGVTRQNCNPVCGSHASCIYIPMYSRFQCQCDSGYQGNPTSGCVLSPGKKSSTHGI